MKSLKGAVESAVSQSVVMVTDLRQLCEPDLRNSAEEPGEQWPDQSGTGNEKTPLLVRSRVPTLYAGVEAQDSSCAVAYVGCAKWCVHSRLLLEKAVVESTELIAS